ncbi:MAG: hypothetical protein HOV81_18270 [Kofleriaceae bacterium]|nr:hypothetical protein [Kofleriaceae bacterium]
MRLVIMLAALSGCAMGGAMRQATMVGQCSKDDATCSRKAPLAPLAIGSRFYPEVSTEITGTTTPNLRLESAEPGVIAVEQGALVAKAAGTSAVLISTDDGSVVDFVHVWAAPVTEITLARRDGERITGALGLAVGEDITLVPSLFNGAQKLAGAPDTTWSLSGEGVVTVLRDGSSDRRRLRARAPGRTTVTVALGDAKASIDVEVVP